MKIGYCGFQIRPLCRKPASAYRMAQRPQIRAILAKNVRRLRLAKGLSQDELAYEAEVSRSYPSQLEKGAFYASLKIVGKLAAVLQVEPAELLRMPPKKITRGK